MLRRVAPLPPMAAAGLYPLMRRLAEPAHDGMTLTLREVAPDGTYRP
jgi:hypothetical protein